MHAPGRRGPQRRRPAFGRSAYGVRRCTTCAGWTRESLDSRGSCRKGHAMRHRSRAARIGLSAVLARQMDVGWVAAAQRRVPPPVTSRHSRRWGSRGSLARKPAPRAALRPTLRIRGDGCRAGRSRAAASPTVRHVEAFAPVGLARIARGETGSTRRAPTLRIDGDGCRVGRSRAAASPTARHVEAFAPVGLARIARPETGSTRRAASHPTHSWRWMQGGSQPRSGEPHRPSRRSIRAGGARADRSRGNRLHASRCVPPKHSWRWM